MQAALNKQINAEFYSAYLYLAMAAYFEENSLKGFGKWLKIQAQEELQHAMKFYDFVNDRGGQVVLFKIEAPEKTWKSPLTAFQAALEHEQKVTGMINNLVALAVDVKDYPSSSFLQWFVDEQVEEEANATEIVRKLLMIGENNSTALLMLDIELGKRSYSSESCCSA